MGLVQAVLVADHALAIDQGDPAEGQGLAGAEGGLSIALVLPVLQRGVGGVEKDDQGVDQRLDLAA